MLSKYFTKVEDRFVFNISLIFWHLLVLLAGLGIILGIVVFLWSIVPSTQRHVEARPIPEKRAYPEPVKVDLSELQLEEQPNVSAADQVQLEPITETARTNAPNPRVAVESEDMTGFDAYEASLGRLRELVPPSLHSWEGSGSWIFPQGQRYWDVYKQEKYRQWVVTEPGVEDKLVQLYKRTKAKDYTAKSNLLTGMNTFLGKIPEADRYDMLLDLTSRSSDSWQNNLAIYNALAPLPAKMGAQANQDHIKALLRTSMRNPTTSVAFIEFITICIERFGPDVRVAALNVATNSFYNFFNQDIGPQKEATELFLELVARIEPNLQSKGLMQYYGLYLKKNEQRRMEIGRIDREYNDLRAQINAEFQQAQMQAMMENAAKQKQKSTFRDRSLLMAGGGILLIVVVAIMLVFLSIQRIVKKIEAKMPDTLGQQRVP